MTDGDALRAAILAEPEDDTLRLVYADWLDENGQPARAAFIRLQVQAAQAEPYSLDARRLADAADRILEQKKGAWTGVVRQRTAAYQFRRGFVERAWVNAASFPRDAAALFAPEPIRVLEPIRFDSTVAAPPPSAPLFALPELARVAKLDLSGLKLPADYFEPLSACPYLDALTDLGLRNTPVPPPWLAALLLGPGLPRLVGLDVSDASHLHQCLADTLPRLARRLVRLDASRIPFSSRQMQQLLGSRCLREVEELRLGWMPGGAEGALTDLEIGWVLPWERLRVLDLSGQGLGDGGVDEIVREAARRPGLSPLRWLGLANNRIGRDAVRALCGSDPAKLKLYHIDVRGNNLPLSAIADLQRRFPEAVVQNL